MRDKWSGLSPRRSSTTRLPVSVASINGKVVLHWPRIGQDSVSTLRILTWLILPFAVLAGRYRLRAKVINGTLSSSRGTSLTP